MSDIPEILTKDVAQKIDHELRKERLTAFIKIGASTPKEEGGPHQKLKEALSESPRSKGRLTLLEEFFSEFIPGGWIKTKEGKWAEDQLFALLLPVHPEAFWWARIQPEAFWWANITDLK